MLPPFIIEQIRNREKRDQASRSRQPMLPLPEPVSAPVLPVREDTGQRGLVVIDLSA